MDGIGKRISLTVLLFAVLFGCDRPVEVKGGAGREVVQDVQYRKDLEEIRKSLKGDIKIKLRKDGKGAYSWEIAGKDPQEIIKANSVLVKRISDEKRE